MAMAMGNNTRGLLAARPFVLYLIKFLFTSLVSAHPMKLNENHSSPYHTTGEEPLPASDATLWVYMAVALVLVLLGGAFAGLTIALMGQVRHRALGPVM